ncbi:hypothetical protein EPN29_03975 [bacterium]|nr:MAG: hypothetical protein EPN29_03975 [bacterium]
MTEAKRPYFRTAISRVEPGKINVRGYDLTELIHGADWVDVAYLVLHGERPTAPHRRMFEAMMCAAADHGFVSTCAVAARYAVSGSGFLPAGIAAGILGIGLHTAMPQRVAEMLREIAPSTELAAGVDDAAIDAAIGERLGRKETIPGFGHPLHRSGDPRTAALLAVARECNFDGGYVRLMERVGERLAAGFGKRLVMNVDGLMGAAFLEMDLTPEEGLAMTILGVLPSIAAHAIEEMRDGAPMRIVPNEYCEDPGRWLLPQG